MRKSFNEMVMELAFSKDDQDARAAGHLGHLWKEYGWRRAWFGYLSYIKVSTTALWSELELDREVGMLIHDAYSVCCVRTKKSNLAEAAAIMGASWLALDVRDEWKPLDSVRRRTWPSGLPKNLRTNDFIDLAMYICLWRMTFSTCTKFLREDNPSLSVIGYKTMSCYNTMIKMVDQISTRKSILPIFSSE